MFQAISSRLDTANDTLSLIKTVLRYLTRNDKIETLNCVVVCVELLRLAIFLQEVLAMKIEDASLGKFSAERGGPMDKAIVDTSDNTFDDTI